MNNVDDADPYMLDSRTYTVTVEYGITTIKGNGIYYYSREGNQLTLEYVEAEVDADL